MAPAPSSSTSASHKHQSNASASTTSGAGSSPRHNAPPQKARSQHGATPSTSAAPPVASAAAAAAAAGSDAPSIASAPAPPSMPSPCIATGPPWTHPPNTLQFPPSAYAQPAPTDLAKRNRADSGSPAPSASSSGPSNPRGKGMKPPQTVADAVAASVGNKKERKRKRIHYSCAECHRRKHKCDRQYPCGPCIDRGIGDTCRPFENGDEHGDYRDRIARLEDIVEALATAQTSLAKELTEARAAGGIRSGSAKQETEQLCKIDDDKDEDEDLKPTKKTRLRPPSLRGIEREELFHAERRTEGIDEDYDGRKVPGTAVESGSNPLEGGLTTEGDAFFGALALPSVSRGAVETEINGERLELGAHLPRFPASFKIARLVSEGGASQNVVVELMDLLPPKSVTDDLLLLYFRDINHTRLPIHEGTFRQSYDALMSFKWGKAREEVGDDGARHVPFLAFLFIMLAIAKRNEPDSVCTEEEAKKGGMKLYHACRKAIHIASYIRADHIDLVLAQLFAARYLITCRQSAESWSMLGSAIRAAQAIGLHRDGSKLGLDAATTERRRRLWSLLFYQDKTTSILLGRPPAIQTHHCDTMAPSDVDVDTMPRDAVAGPPKWAQEGTPPGVFTFVAIRHALTIITGKIAEHFQNLSQARSYSDVIKLDEELEQFKANLPAPYRTEEDSGGIDRSFDEVCPWLPLHRYLISVEYHYVRCTLHRPYLLRNSEKYALSRNAAFASARADRRVRKEYRRDVKWPSDRARKRHMGGLYRLFSSTLITGIELLLDPTCPDASEMMATLDEFIEKHNRRAEKDQCSKREVAIIELFRTKAKDPSWCARKAAKRANMRAGTQQVPADGSVDTGANQAPRPGPFAPVADSPTSGVPGRLTPGVAGANGASNNSPGMGTGLPNLNIPATLNQQELAQSIFDTLGGGLDQFGLSSSLSAKAGNGHGTLNPSDGTTTFGGIGGPGMSLPGETAGDMSVGAADYSSFWGSADFPANGSNGNGNALTPTMAGQAGAAGPWNPVHGFQSAAFAAGSGNHAHATASPASSGSGSNGLANIDWSADSLVPWGAMIEAIAMQKPGQVGLENGSNVGSGPRHGAGGNAGSKQSS